jgi:hypothetical protein
MKITINYRSDTLLPAGITDILEKTKERLLKLSAEPDKTIILFDVMRKELINWIDSHAEIVKEHGKKTGCEMIGCPYWNGYFCCDRDPKYDAVCRYNDCRKN